MGMFQWKNHMIYAVRVARYHEFDGWKLVISSIEAVDYGKSLVNLYPKSANNLKKTWFFTKSIQNRLETTMGKKNKGIYIESID